MTASATSSFCMAAASSATSSGLSTSPRASGGTCSLKPAPSHPHAPARPSTCRARTFFSPTATAFGFGSPPITPGAAPRFHSMGRSQRSVRTAPWCTMQNTIWSSWCSESAVMTASRRYTRCAIRSDMSQNRRTFLETGSAAVAAGFLNLNQRALGANEKIALGLIGGRNQGKHDALAAINQGAEIKAFCDLDDAILAKTGAQIEEAQGKGPEFVKDFRRLLDDKSIDAVIIATPDHWHAGITIQACQAGKDVYIEKPLSQTIHE